MADKKISQLTALAAANLAPSTDVLAIVDTSATETKKIVAQDLINGVLNVASAVGIGTASPAFKLDVLDGTANGNVGTPIARIVGANQAITGETGTLSLQSNSNMAVDTGGSIIFGGRGTTASTNSVSYGHIAGRKENGTSGNFAGYLQFGTSDSASDITERMRLDSSGVLLVGNTTNYGVGSAENNSVQVKGPIVLAANNTGSASNRNWVFQTNAAAAGSFSLAYSSTNTGWPNAAYALVVDASGNLGVGTTSPDIFGRFYTRSVGFSSSGTTALQINGTTYGTIDLGAGGTRTTSLTGTGTEAQLATVTAIPILFTTNNTERARITSGGDFLVGTTAAPDGTANYGGGFVSTTNSRRELYLATSSTSANNLARFYNPNGEVGNIQTNGTATAFNTSSDRRLKENIAPADDAGAIVDAIQVVKHDWKAGGHTRYGMIAQDLHEVAPEAVSAGDNGEEIIERWSVDYSKLVPMLVKELQSVRARLAALETK